MVELLVVVNLMPCLQIRLGIWCIHSFLGCFCVTRQKNFENLSGKAKSFIQRFTPASSGVRERCSGKHHQGLDYGCLTLIETKMC